MLNPKQVALLQTRFGDAGIHGNQRQLDYLFEHDVDIAADGRGRPCFENMTNAELNAILRALGEPE